MDEMHIVRVKNRMTLIQMYIFYNVMCKENNK